MDLKILLPVVIVAASVQINGYTYRKCWYHSFGSTEIAISCNETDMKLYVHHAYYVMSTTGCYGTDFNLQEEYKCTGEQSRMTIMLKHYCNMKASCSVNTTFPLNVCSDNQNYTAAILYMDYECFPNATTIHADDFYPLNNSHQAATVYELNLYAGYSTDQPPLVAEQMCSLEIFHRTVVKIYVLQLTSNSTQTNSVPWPYCLYMGNQNICDTSNNVLNPFIIELQPSEIIWLRFQREDTSLAVAATFWISIIALYNETFCNHVLPGEMRITCNGPAASVTQTPAPTSTRPPCITLLDPHSTTLGTPQSDMSTSLDTQYGMSTALDAQSTTQDTSPKETSPNDTSQVGMQTNGDRNNWIYAFVGIGLIFIIIGAVILVYCFRKRSQQKTDTEAEISPYDSPEQIHNNLHYAAGTLHVDDHGKGKASGSGHPSNENHHAHYDNATANHQYCDTLDANAVARNNDMSNSPNLHTNHAMYEDVDALGKDKGRNKEYTQVPGPVYAQPMKPQANKNTSSPGSPGTNIAALSDELEIMENDIYHSSANGGSMELPGAIYTETSKSKSEGKAPSKDSIGAGVPALSDDLEVNDLTENDLYQSMDHP